MGRKNLQVQQVALKMQQLCKSQIVKLQALKADTLKNTVYEISLKKSHFTNIASEASYVYVKSWLDGVYEIIFGDFLIMECLSFSQIGQIGKNG